MLADVSDSYACELQIDHEIGMLQAREHQSLHLVALQHRVHAQRRQAADASGMPLHLHKHYAKWRALHIGGHLAHRSVAQNGVCYGH